MPEWTTVFNINDLVRNQRIVIYANTPGNSWPNNPPMPTKIVYFRMIFRDKFLVGNTPNDRSYAIEPRRIKKVEYIENQLTLELYETPREEAMQRIADIKNQLN